MSRYPTFWMEPNGRVCVFLRRYATCVTHDNARPAAPPCASGRLFHDARMLYLNDAAESDWLERHQDGEAWYWRNVQEVPATNPAWPTMCEHCSYQFLDEDVHQTNPRRLYTGAPDGIVRPEDHFPVGALFDADWMQGTDWVGPDGISLACVLPDGTRWLVDSQANNCGKPGTRDPRNGRSCWGRTGDPRTGTVTVGIGCDCGVGGGSIASPGYHGFLRNGALVPA